jgi:hypothetical protein
MAREIGGVDYPNFKDSVTDDVLHEAYLAIWVIMAQTQSPPPYSGGGFPALRMLELRDR